MSTAVPEMKNPVDQDGPGKAPFLKKYNERLEMPIAFVGSICAHTLFVFLLVFGLFILMDGKKQRESVPIMMVDGDSDKGVGSAGSGGIPDPIIIGSTKPTFEEISRALPSALPEISKQVEDQIRMENPDIKVPAAELAALSQLDDELRKKFITNGQRKGDGTSTGSGASGQVGDGPGGYGADSTRARSMRWVMQFTITDGRDYLRQLSVLKATVLVPIPPANKEMMIFTDLQAGTPNRVATSKEIDELSRQMRFCDITAKAVSDIGSTFRLNFQPQCFFAFFPKALEERLAKDEERFRGRKSKDIEETKFKVTISGDSYDIRIVDQVPRKK